MTPYATRLWPALIWSNKPVRKMTTEIRLAAPATAKIATIWKTCLVSPMVHAPTYISNSIFLLTYYKLTRFDFMQAIVRMATRLFTVKAWEVRLRNTALVPPSMA